MKKGLITLAALVGWLWLALAGFSWAAVDERVCSVADQAGCTGTNIRTNINEELPALGNRAPRLLTGLSGSNDYVACTSPAVTALVDGASFWLSPAADNTGATTLNLCALGVRALVAANGLAHGAGDVKASTRVLIQWQAGNNQFRRVDAGAGVAAQRRQPRFAADYLLAGDAANPPFAGSAIATGTVAATTSTLSGDRPGVVRVTSSTSAGSGYRFQTDASSLRLAGGEAHEAVVNFANLALTTARLGFHDSTTSADAVDGAYIEVPTTGAAVCKSASNSTRSTSATIATLTINTWYLTEVVVAPDASSVTCRIYSAAGALLGSQTATGNMPTAAGRETQAGIAVTQSGTAAIAIFDLDYQALRFGEGRALLR